MLDPLDPLDPRARLKPTSDTALAERPPEGRSVPHAADPRDWLGEDEREVLVALAAAQLRYGEAAEALAYLMVARRLFPGDEDILRLTADALLKLGRTDEADAVLTELERMRPGPLAMLTRALVNLARSDLAAARRAFGRFRESEDESATRQWNAHVAAWGEENWGEGNGR